MPSLNNVTTTDSYDDNILECPGARQLFLTVANKAIYMSVSQGGARNPEAWQPDEYWPPGYYTIPKAIDQLRIRSAVAGEPAQVTANAY